MRRTSHVTAPVDYVRLHESNYKEWFQADNRNDRYNYLYKPKELEGWKEKITQISQQTEKLSSSRIIISRDRRPLELQCRDS